MTIEEWFQRAPITTIVVVVLGVAAVAFVAYLFARLLVRSLNDSAQAEQPLTTLMLILGTVTIVALVGALFTGNESAYTVAATGVGAFAGTLTARAQMVHGNSERYPDSVPAPVEEETGDFPTGGDPGSEDHS